MTPSKTFFSPESRALKLRELPGVYETLRRYFGPQHWWPAQTTFEVVVGAILTQNTAWSNVEKAIVNLRRAKCLTPQALRRIPKRKLASLIRSAGYFNVKAERLKSFVDFLFLAYQGQLERMFREEGKKLRANLLSVKGIGPETADSILLYAAKKPFFVIDAYTKRIFARHRVGAGKPKSLLLMSYDDWQRIFFEALPKRIGLYNDFHAQIVALGKHFCKSKRPLCSTCPLAVYL